MYCANLLKTSLNTKYIYTMTGFFFGAGSGGGGEAGCIFYAKTLYIRGT